VAALLRTFLTASVIAIFAMGWASVRASAAGHLDLQITVLEIKDRAWSIQQLATNIAGQTRDLSARSQAMGVAYQARRLHDRAEKALRP
jgi:hypothetical protein